MLPSAHKINKIIVEKSSWKKPSTFALESETAAYKWIFKSTMLSADGIFWLCVVADTILNVPQDNFAFLPAEAQKSNTVFPYFTKLLS